MGPLVFLAQKVKKEKEVNLPMPCQEPKDTKETLAFLVFLVNLEDLEWMVCLG